MAAFERKSLREVLGDGGYIRGPFGSALVRSELQTEGIPVYEQQHAITGTRTFRFFISEQKFRELSRFQVRSNDLIISCSGTVGRISVVQPGDPKGIISQALLILRPHSRDVLPEFLYYFLSTREGRHSLLQASHGSVQVNIAPRAVVEDIQLPIPTLDEQRQIVHVLSSLDDKIELNRRMSETLEAMARALFKSWFVDFDPVRAKAEGRHIGLPKRIADLFPDSFEDSEIGEVPKGWKTATLSALSALNPESWSTDTRPAAVDYVDLSNTKWGRIESVAHYATELAPSRAQRVLHPGDTILGTVRPGNGSFALVAQEGLTGSTGFAVLRPTRETHVEFVYLAATASENIDALSHLADGGAYPAVRPEAVAETAIVNPSTELLDYFSTVVGPQLTKLAENQRESRLLVALRDALLPRLVSGELRLAHGTAEEAY